MSPRIGLEFAGVDFERLDEAETPEGGADKPSCVCVSTAGWEDPALGGVLDWPDRELIVFRGVWQDDVFESADFR